MLHLVGNISKGIYLMHGPLNVKFKNKAYILLVIQLTDKCLLISLDY